MICTDSLTGRKAEDTASLSPAGPKGHAMPFARTAHKRVDIFFYVYLIRHLIFPQLMVICSCAAFCCVPLPACRSCISRLQIHQGYPSIFSLCARPTFVIHRASAVSCPAAVHAPNPCAPVIAASLCRFDCLNFPLYFLYMGSLAALMQILHSFCRSTVYGLNDLCILLSSSSPH